AEARGQPALDEAGAELDPVGAGLLGGHEPVNALDADFDPEMFAQIEPPGARCRSPAPAWQEGGGFAPTSVVPRSARFRLAEAGPRHAFGTTARRPRRRQREESRWRFFRRWRGCRRWRTIAAPRRSNSPFSPRCACCSWPACWPTPS